MSDHNVTAGVVVQNQKQGAETNLREYHRDLCTWDLHKRNRKRMIEWAQSRVKGERERELPRQQRFHSSYVCGAHVRTFLFWMFPGRVPISLSSYSPRIINTHNVFCWALATHTYTKQERELPQITQIWSSTWHEGEVGERDIGPKQHRSAGFGAQRWSKRERGQGQARRRGGGEMSQWEAGAGSKTRCKGNIKER